MFNINYEAISCMRDVEKYHYQRCERSYWFSDGAMSFFNTVLYDKVYQENSSPVYFITSEVNPSNVKAFSIRKLNKETGTIDTIGKFHSYESYEDAEKEIYRLLAEFN